MKKIKTVWDGKKVLLQDIVIPKGTVFLPSPNNIKSYGEGHFDATFGLSKNTFGTVYYTIDSECEDELSEWFVDLK